MTYLKILSYARRGIRAEIDNYRAMQEKPWKVPERTRRPRALRTASRI